MCSNNQLSRNHKTKHAKIHPMTLLNIISKYLLTYATIIRYHMKLSHCSINK
jgi:hypothetical protein